MRWRNPGPIRHPPGFVEPCLPTNGCEVPSGDQWAYEIKHDGFRFIVRRELDRVRGGSCGTDRRETGRPVTMPALRYGGGQSLRNPGQLHDWPPPYRPWSSREQNNEATIASSGTFLHEAIRTVILIAARQGKRHWRARDCRRMYKIC
jgi:hypothetical protein